MLNWREWALLQLKEAEKEVEASTLKFQSAEEFLEKVSELPERLHYCRRGQTLFVKNGVAFGYCSIVLERAKKKLAKKLCGKAEAADAEELAKMKLAEMEKEAEKEDKKKQIIQMFCLSGCVNFVVEQINAQI